MKKLYKQSGIRGVYKGTCATLLRGKVEHFNVIQRAQQSNVNKTLTCLVLIFIGFKTNSFGL